MTDATGCVVLASASTCNLPSPARGLPVGFGTFAFCSLCPYAARCPVPVASDDADLIPELIFSWHADDGQLSWCDRNHGHGQSAHTHQAAPCCGPGLSPGLLFSLHAAVAGGLQPTSVSAPSSRAAARMSGGTDLGHRRRPGPRQARAAPVTPILPGFGRGTPGFHPEGCAGFNSRSSELKPAQPWELKPAAGIRTSTGTDADDLPPPPAGCCAPAHTHRPIDRHVASRSRGGAGRKPRGRGGWGD